MVSAWAEHCDGVNTCDLSPLTTRWRYFATYQLEQQAARMYPVFQSLTHSNVLLNEVLGYAGYDLYVEGLDQVLDMLLLKGDWIKRASFGWLPSSYLRMMPAYYRGVDPVIDHDHGNRPGLLKHSEAKPQMPPVRAPIPSPRCAPLPCSLDCLLTADLLLR